ncbi:nucleocapsid [Fikirini virus]|uniref:Nucleoprotein n=1 Tax=Fikirini virus TaxID=1408144 RepID=U5NEN0_9RHAB|nr:nucleocapsid [Fikirini virus]AGY14294.1 nucleocapsid [Fikirini virus]
MSEKNRLTVFRLASRLPVKLTLPQESTPVQYASKWFEVNKDQKPTLTVGHKNTSKLNLLQYAARALETGTLTAEAATAVLYKVFLDEKHQLLQEWTSFGVQIAPPKVDVTPWDLVKIVEKDTNLPNNELNQTITEDDQNWIAFYICFLYRFSRATHTDYKDQLYSRAIEHVKNISSNTHIIQPGALTQMKNIILHPQYNMAIACIDMYFNKFKTSPRAMVRYGTLPSRFKDCSALTTLNQVTRMIGVSIEQFMLWVFSNRMADELDQMAKEGEELDKGDSYVAYMRELGLSDRSPYSTQANPSFSLFCHIVGTLLGSKRSKNAKMGLEVDTVNSMLNAKVAAYVLGTRPSFELAYNTVLPPPDEKEKVDELPHGPIPTGTDPEEWFSYLSEYGFQLPEEIERWVRARVNLITDTRDGTVGKYVKSQI